MIRYISLIILFLSVQSQAWSQQQLFDCEQSGRFAKYLFNTGQYQLSQHELERIQFFCNPDSSTQLLLLKTYRKLSQYTQENIFFADKNISQIGKMSPEFRLEYIKLQMMQQNYAQVQFAIQQGLDFEQKQEHILGASLLQMNWEEAHSISEQYGSNINYKLLGLKQIAKRSYEAKRKKPWLATAMSVVIPGAGKAYSGYWGDAAISFLFTASSSFFAYRAFQKYGNNNIYPWIIGGLAVSYYTANIYGGNRAAVHYNDNLNHGFIHETENILYSDY